MGWRARVEVVLVTSTELVASSAARERHAARRRRPVGEPPPLPRAVSRGAWLLIGSAVAVVAVWITGAVAVSGLGVWFNEREGVVVRWIADHRAEWLTDVLEVVHEIGDDWAVPAVAWATMVLLVAARRLRHLLVFVAGLMATSYLVLWVAPIIGRSRPWGVEQLAAWEGFANPSLPAAQLAAVFVGAMYGLVPGAQNRSRVKVVVVVLLGLFGFARVYLGVEYPLDPINGAVIGAAIMAAGFVFFCPEQVFPVGFQRGRTAHLDIGGRRGGAIRVAVAEQLGCDVDRPRTGRVGRVSRVDADADHGRG